jgi:hypothetical protein
MPHCLPAAEKGLRALARAHQVLLAGPSATKETAERVGAGLIEADPVSAGAWLTAH